MQQIDRVASLTTPNGIKLKSNKCQKPSRRRNWQTWIFLARKFHGKLSEEICGSRVKNLLRLFALFLCFYVLFLAWAHEQNNKLRSCLKVMYITNYQPTTQSRSNNPRRILTNTAHNESVMLVEFQYCGN